MIWTIPISSDSPDYEQQVTLSGETYILTARWNARAGRWFLSLADAAGDVVWQGVKASMDLPIRMHSTSAIKPDGQLWIVDASGSGVDAGLMDLGSRVQLVYVEAPA